MTEQLESTPVESNPFALCFHGFEDRSPEALQRFKSFCVTNLNLSNEDTMQILSQPGVAVICRKASIHDLKDVVCAFEEIGTRVSICGPNPDSPDQEISHLASIAPQLEQLLKAPTIRATPPRGVSEGYHFTLDPEVRTLRARSIRTRATSRRRGDLSATQMIGLILAGMVGLIGLNRSLLPPIGQASPSATGPVATAWELSQQSRTPRELPPNVVKHYDGTVIRSDYSLTLSVRAQEDALSARVLLVTPSEQLRNSAGTEVNNPRLRRAESDTTLLEQRAPGVWSGVLMTYLFIEHGDDRRRVLTQSKVSVRGPLEASGAQATVEILASSETGDLMLRPDPAPIQISDDGSYELSITEQIKLERQLE